MHTGYVVVHAGEIRQVLASWKGFACVPAVALLDALIECVLDGLPEAERLSTWLHHCEGMTIMEVAIVLSLPEEDVRRHVARGMAMMRDTLWRMELNIPAALLTKGLMSLSRPNLSAKLVDGIGRILKEGVQQ
ncbi:MAG: hypothetical protein C0404_11990 [Verrucomicrobia bacterium]|nr:hypothetical protein [Verrucomicrobiota bacterium]